MESFTVTPRSSSLSSWSNCARSAAADLYPDLVASKGYNDIRPRRENIGANVGTAMHAGLEAVLRGQRTVAEAYLAATTKLDELVLVDGYDGWDKTTPDYDSARLAVSKLVEVGFPVAMAIEPDEIEAEYMTQIDVRTGAFIEQATDGAIPQALIAHALMRIYGVTFSGHIDVETTDGVILDWKSGKATPSPEAQLGSYLIHRAVRGKKVSGLKSCFIQRVGKRTPQPPPVIREYNMVECVKAALSGLYMQHVQMAAFLESGDIWDLPPNPMSVLCSKKWCRAWNTSACAVGKGSDKEGDEE